MKVQTVSLRQRETAFLVQVYIPNIIKVSTIYVGWPCLVGRSAANLAKRNCGSLPAEMRENAGDCYFCWPRP